MVTNFPLALAAMGATRPPKPWNSNLPACLHFKDTPLPRDPALNFVVTHMRLLISVGYKLSMPLDDHPGVVTDRVIMCFRPLLGWLNSSNILRAVNATGNKLGRWVWGPRIDEVNEELEVCLLVDVSDLMD
jgi:hypothetical protein